MLEAISNGMFHVSMKEKMGTLEARKAELDTKLAAVPAEDPIILHPALAEAYGAKIRALASNLDDVLPKNQKSNHPNRVAQPHLRFLKVH